MDRDRRVSANRGCDSYVKAILRALRAPAQVEVEPAEPAVAEPAPPDELHLTSSHTDKLIAQLLKRAESKPADEAACAPADAPADDSADDSEDDSREDGRSHNGELIENTYSCNDESLKAYLAPTGLVSEPRGDLTCRGDLRLEVPKTV